MNALLSPQHASPAVLRRDNVIPTTHAPKDNERSRTAFNELERRVKAALETYSNVHRGAGHHSWVTTELFEQSRAVVLDCLGLDPAEHVVVFCTPHRAATLKARLAPAHYREVSSQAIGLPIGLRALAVRKRALPGGVPFQTGGGVVELVLPDSVIWADAPHRFEAGTPPVIGAIALAAALRIRRQLGDDCFMAREDPVRPATRILDDDDISGSSGSRLLEELRGQLVGRDLRVPTGEGHRPFINLDNAASTPTFLPVWNAVTQTWRQSDQVHADIAREVRTILAAFLGASVEQYEVIFTANTTEALNLAARLVQSEFNDDPNALVLNTLLEHNSNELPWRYIRGASPIRLSVDSDGFVDLEELELVLRQYNHDGVAGAARIRLVAVTGSSNVLGTFNDIAAIGRIAHKYGARLLVDAAQVVAHRSLHMGEAGIDYLAFSGHKVYAPFGTGALVVRKEHIHVDPGELAHIKASGDENVVGIAALGKAVSLLRRIGMPVIEAAESALLRRLLRGLSGVRGIEILGIGSPDSRRIHDKGGVVSFCLTGVPHNLVAKALAERAGIGVRNGCFCAHLLIKHLMKVRPAKALATNVGLLLLPGLTRAFLPGLVRVSLGLGNDDDDVDHLIRALEEVAAAPLSAVNRLLAIGRNGTPFLSRTSVQGQMESFVASRTTLIYSPESDA